MDRRDFIKVAAAGVSLTAVGFAGWLAAAPAAEALTIDFALERLRSLEGRTLRANAGWEPARALVHCGQSVVCSMEGYPIHKPDWFKTTVGPLALGVFGASGAMRHNTAEEVPGLQSAGKDAATRAALAELQEIYERFGAYRGPLREHFAYGALSKRDYEIAHVLHLLDHLDEFDVS